jgi:COP9 signalosome complex subunit 7
VFAELLDLPNIQELKGDEVNGKHYTMLELFAYGTNADYISERPTSRISVKLTMRIA